MRLDSSTGSWRDSACDQGCDRVALLITRQVDGELAPEDARDLRGHLAVCAACRTALEMQSAQSKLLAQNLRALWKTDDRAAQKKKELTTFHKSLEFKRFFSKAAACAALAAGMIFFAATARAPSESAAANDSRAPTARISTEHPIAPVTSIPAVAHADQLAASAPSDDDRPRVAIQPVVTPPYVEPDDTLPNSPDETKLEVVLETPAGEFGPLVQPVILAPEIKAPRFVGQTLAELATTVPLKPLSGVSLKYSMMTPSGATERGTISLLGDVLHGKGAVRIETSAGQKWEAAQADIDTVLAEPHRSAARKFLIECLEPANRKRIERAIEKLGE